MKMEHLVEVEPGRGAADGCPSAGPVYRSAFAKDGFPPAVSGIESCWDVFRSGFGFTLSLDFWSLLLNFDC